MKHFFLVVIIASCAMEAAAQELLSFSDPKTKLYGFKDKKTGKVVAEAAYSAVSYYNEDMVAVKLNDKWGFINGKGKLVIPMQFDNASGFSEGYGAVGKNILSSQGYVERTDWGFIDKTGKLVIPYKYSTPGVFRNGFAIVSNANAGFASLSGVINKKGKEVIPVKYTALADRYDGLFKAATGNVTNYNGKYGFLDSTGKAVIPFVYDDAMDFSEGLAAVKKDGKYGFINNKGAVVIPFQFDGPTYFEKGKASVEKAGVSFYINKKGERVN